MASAQTNEPALDKAGEGEKGDSSASRSQTGHVLFWIKISRETVRAKLCISKYRTLIHSGHVPGLWGVLKIGEGIEDAVRPHGDTMVF